MGDVRLIDAEELKRIAYRRFGLEAIKLITLIDEMPTIKENKGKTENGTTHITGLKIKQALPLEIKVNMTIARIRAWVDYYGLDGVYVSFSGGKDSTVLLHIARSIYPDIKAVFVDTGLEYPEIRDFVKKFDNVDWLKPKLTFKQVIEKYGYPFISKEVAECVQGARKYLTELASSDNIIKTDRQTDRQTV